MISILIPVFNVNVVSLVQELSRQISGLSVPGEILVYDDHSSPEVLWQNAAVISTDKVVYKQAEKNIGRVGMRSLLAQDAQYEWLLFIDSDSEIVSDKYLSNYLSAIQSQKCDVFSGGRRYQAEEPTDCSKRLHWKYGKERESVGGGKDSLHTNNFCIRKIDFLQLAFPTEIKGYGHEDTWMEMTLRNQKKEIQFIDNPVLHAGLEDSDVFLEKTKFALQNLLLLPLFFKHGQVTEKIMLYKVFYWLKKSGVDKLTRRLLGKKIKAMEQNLTSCTPSLFQFDCYRLFYLLEYSKKQA